MSTHGDMDGPEKMHLMLLFTRGSSMRSWDSVGMFERETALYRRLARRLSGVRFLTYGDNGEHEYQERLNGIDIVANERGLGPTKFSVLAPFLHRKEFREVQVIKTNQLDGAWMGVIAKLLFRKKLIVRCGYIWSVFQRHRLGNGLAARFFVFLEKVCVKLADRCVVATEHDGEYLREIHGVGDEKIKVIPNFVDTDMFRPLPEIEREPGLVCFIGRLAPQKNVDALLEACRGLEGVRLLVIGDGELRDALREKAAALGLPVEFHARIPNEQLPACLNRAEVFVLPSNYEGCPKTLLEAMACELPVVGTDVEGIRNIIRSGENGVLCEKSPEGIRNAITGILNDKATARQMAERARQYVLERHSLDRIVEMELETIRHLFKS